LEDLGNAEKYYKNSAKIKNRSGLTRKLARLDSLQTTAQNKLEKGLSAFKEENYKKAADLYASALKINPGLKPARYHLRLSKGMIFYEKGGKMDQWDAIEQFGLASTLCPKSSEPHYYMGLAYYKKNKKDYNAYGDAISEFRCAIELEPNSIIADKARKKIESLKAYQKKMRDFWGK
jgi:tetratricopeptide (TPR) repeat protein